jgi:hypothetical protein
MAVVWQERNVTEMPALDERGGPTKGVEPLRGDARLFAINLRGSCQETGSFILPAGSLVVLENCELTGEGQEPEIPQGTLPEMAEADEPQPRRDIDLIWPIADHIKGLSHGSQSDAISSQFSMRLSN